MTFKKEVYVLVPFEPNGRRDFGQGLYFRFLRKKKAACIRQTAFRKIEKD